MLEEQEEPANDVEEMQEEEEMMYASSQKSSWIYFIISMVVHIAIASLIMLLESDATPVRQVTMHMNVALHQEPEPLKMDRPVQPEVQPSLSNRPEEPEVSDTIFKENSEISDHNETANEEDFAMSKGDPQASSDSPFEGKFQNNELGIGGGVGGMFGDRFGGRRNLSKSGGGVVTETAVQLGLEWLKKHQTSEGNWDVDGFSSMCNGTPVCDGKGDPQYDPAITGLALLCFLGAGHTTTNGNYQTEVKKGLQYLLSVQDANGAFGSCNTSRHMYNHALATLAIVEAHAVCPGNPMLKDAAQKGIDFLLKAQTVDGGWRYSYQPGDDDTSVMGWCVMALKAAKTVGLNVPSNSFVGARLFLDRVTTPSYTVAYRCVNGQHEFENLFMDIQHIFQLPTSYMSHLERGVVGEELKQAFAENNYPLGYDVILEKNQLDQVTVGLGSVAGNQQILAWKLTDASSKNKYLLAMKNDILQVSKINRIFAVSPSMLAVSMTSRIFMQVNTKEDEYLVRGSEILSQSPPQWGENEQGHSLVNYYYWYYGTLAMYQIGGENWNRWNQHTKDVLLAHQEKQGCQRGSWTPEGRTCQAGGRIYSTALSILCLEIYYRYTQLLN